MATFEELMEKFRNPGDEGIPETFADELSSAYTEDISIRDAAVTDRDKKIEDAEKEKAALAAEVLRMKAVQYDLLMAAPKAGNPADDNKPDNAEEPRGIDSLFE